jgi:hypothetical protein
MLSQDSKHSSRRLLGKINSFSKVVGYKINIQKAVAFLHADKKYVKKVIRKKIPIPNSFNKIARNKPIQ